MDHSPDFELFKERLQLLEQAVARRLQAHGDAHLLELIFDLQDRFGRPERGQTG